MLAQKYRLVRQSDFDLVFKNGKKAFGRLFFMRFAPNKLENTRFAVIIRLNLSKFEQNIDIIINILTPSVGCDYEELEKELLEIFQKYKLIAK